MFDNPNVVGIARGLKSINGCYCNIPCLTVFVEKKIHSDKISSSNIIPNEFYGVLTDVIEMGQMNLLKRSTPATGGAEISLYKDTGFGTLGYAVTDRGTKKNLYALTCAHILEDELLPNIREVVQPAYKNNGEKIGTVERISKKKYYNESDESSYNEIDGGIVNVGLNDLYTQRTILTPQLPGGVVLRGTASGKLDDYIMKYGAETSLTKGHIIGVDAAIFQEDEIFFYKNQIITNNRANFGDSGSVGVIINEMKVFGLLMGGTDTLSVYNPIDKVLDYFNVEIAMPITK